MEMFRILYRMGSKIATYFVIVGIQKTSLMKQQPRMKTNEEELASGTQNSFVQQIFVEHLPTHDSDATGVHQKTKIIAFSEPTF